MLKFAASLAAAALLGLLLAVVQIDPALALSHVAVVAEAAAEPSFIDYLGQLIGVSAGTLAVILLVGRQLAEVIAKLIPDTATGFMGVLRKLAKMLSGYVPNQA